jgi:hypothetical protein
MKQVGARDPHDILHGVVTRGTHRGKNDSDFRRFCVCFFSLSNRDDGESAQFCSFGSTTLKEFAPDSEDGDSSKVEDWLALPLFLTPEVEWGDEEVQDELKLCCQKKQSIMLER